MFQFTCQFSLQNIYTSALNFRSIQTVILVLSDTSSFRILEIVLRFPLVLMSLEHNAASLLTYASVSHHFCKNLLSNRTVFCMSNTIKMRQHRECVFSVRRFFLRENLRCFVRDLISLVLFLCL